MRSLFLIILVYLSTFAYTRGQSNSDLVLTVTSAADDGPGSLRSTIIEAKGGQTIYFSNALIYDTIRLVSGEIKLDKSLKIIGPGKDLLTITSQNNSRAFNITDQTQIEIIGITIWRSSVPAHVLDRDSNGGAILSEGILSLTECKIEDCHAVNSGGAIYADTLILFNSEIIGNSGAKFGGGIFGRSITATNSTISYNQAKSKIEPSRNGPKLSKSCAGGIFAIEYLNINQCTISNNSCDLHGGGIYIANPRASQSLRIANSSIVYNSAEIGGGIFEEFSTITNFSNNIIADNIGHSQAPDLYFSGLWEYPDSVNNNLIGSISREISIPGRQNKIGTLSEPINPKMDSLKYNGGPTRTIAIKECSPSIDAGFISGYSIFDQRGIDRIIGANIDIGPFEYEDPFNQDCDQQAYKKYIIIAEKEIKLKNNLVLNGGVGTLNPGAKVTLEDSTMIVAPSTFVKADVIEMKDGSVVTNSFMSGPDFTLPNFITNSKEGTLSIRINKNEIRILTDSIYKDVDIKENGTLILTKPRVYIENLKMDPDSKLEIDTCVQLIIKDILECRKRTIVNINNKGLKIYANKVKIEEGAHITADIYAVKSIKSTGKKNSPALLRGQFIAEKIEGDDHVIWDWNLQNKCNSFDFNSDIKLPECDLTIDAGIDKSVLFSRFFSNFSGYSCVFINASVSGGTPPYTYRWSPQLAMSDPTSSRPSVCPTETTTYRLSVTDAQGCFQEDEVIISAYNIIDILSSPSCNNGGPFKKSMCDIETNETLCVSVFSSSERNGLGANLNRGNTLGPCNNFTEKEMKSNAANSKMNTVRPWPNPASEIIHFPLHKMNEQETSLTIYNSYGQIILHHIYPVKQEVIHLPTTEYLPGVYFYYLNNISGKFVIVK